MFERFKRRLAARKQDPAPAAPEASPPLADGEGSEGPALAGPSEPEPSARVRKTRKYSAADRARILEELANSDLGVPAFAKQAGVAYSTLKAWTRPPRKQRASSSPQSKRYTPEERRAAVEAFTKSGRNRQDFARLWGCSASSLDKWLKRYRDDGPKGLETRVRKHRPGRPHPSRVPDSVRELIVEIRSKHEDYGVTRIVEELKRFHGVKLSASGVRKILLEKGVGVQAAAAPKSRPKSKPPRRFERARPGQMWQSDITSFVLRRQGRRVYLTVFLDDHSRYVVAWGLESQQRTSLVSDALLEGIARFGKPEEVLTDQGRQYFAWRGKSGFQKLLIKEGIGHVVSRTHHPQTLGKCERLWKTVGTEFWDRAKPQDLEDARRRLGHWISHYNHFRPHQGIDGLVPADRFFGVADAVREALERGYKGNELRLALDEPPRQSVYLVGQIGSQRISLHGERGKLLIDTPEGGEREIAMDELGVEARSQTEDQEAQDDIDPDKQDNREESANGRIEPDSAATDEAAHSPGPQAHKLPKGASPGVASAGSLGECAQGGQRALAPKLHADLGVLAGQEEQVGGGQGVGGEPAQGLATESKGTVGDAGGIVGAAAAEGRPRSIRTDRKRVSCAAEKAAGSAREGTRTDRRPGAGAAIRPVAAAGCGVTSERRKEPCQETQTQGSQKESREKSECGSADGSGRGPARRRKWLRWLNRTR